MTFEVFEYDGKPISKPGIWKNVPMADYHGQLTVGPSISSSGLRTIFNRSLAHYYAGSYLNPNRVEQADSEAFLIGRCGHFLLLGEANFRQHFCVQPEAYPDPKTGEDKPWNNNATFCRNWKAVAACEGLSVVTPSQIEIVRGIAKSLQANPLVQAGILNGLVEHSMVWQDEETGVWQKARPDCIPTSDLDMADLKIVADVSDDAIERSIGDYGYHQQAALVGEACRKLLGREMSSFSLVCAEKAAPNCVQIRSLSKDAYLLNDASAPEPSDLEIGEIQNRAALRLFAMALESGNWPGPGGDQSDAKTVRMKPFARSRISFRLKGIEQEILANNSLREPK